MSGDHLLFLTAWIRQTAAWKTTFVYEQLVSWVWTVSKCFALVECFACCLLGDSC